MSREIKIDQERLVAELQHLATYTEPPTGPVAEGDTAVTRVVFTERDREARAYVGSLASAANLRVREDAVGNTFFRWQGTAPHLPAIATGSHIDAIPNAGMYDGTVGVLGGLEAIRALQASGFAPLRSIELILFTSEEPTRFGIGCLGSRLMSGTLAPNAADALKDRQQQTLEQVRTAAGYTGTLASVRLQADHYAGFVELHIEQGPLLERACESIGVVTAIAAPASSTITIDGLGGHAGALLMPDRRDALTAAAEVILAVEAAALRDRLGGHSCDGWVVRCVSGRGELCAEPCTAVAGCAGHRPCTARRRAAAPLRTPAATLQPDAGVSLAAEVLNADAPDGCATHPSSAPSMRSASGTG